MRISARADYAVRAALQLAVSDERLSAEAIAAAQDIPGKFLEGILTELRKAGLVDTRRGPSGGTQLSAPAETITVGAVVRAVDGPLVFVRDARPPDLEYDGASEGLLDVWVALRVNVRQVLDTVTLADVVGRRLPADVAALVGEPDAWDNP